MKSHPFQSSPGARTFAKAIGFPLFLALVLFSCKPAEDPEDNTDLNAATNFIQSALKGDFRAARKYMVNDSTDLELLSAIEQSNSKLSKEEKEGYRGASVHIHQRRIQDDSTTIISYSNSYKDILDSLKVIRRNGDWKVDFKYMLHHNPDLLP